jgi:6,7-dimethyl-8-ribityllumazine synthase
MIAIVKAQFNSHITDLLEVGCTDYLTEQNIPFSSFECPGAVETVVYANKLISTGKYKSIIVIGAIIKGDTDHY